MLVAGLASACCAFLLALILLTDAAPKADARPAPTAEQVGAGRDALYQLRNGRRAAGGTNRIDFGPAQLDGLSALATHGLHPDRLDMYTDGGAFYASASHALPLGRWLNVDLTVAGRGNGFPPAHLRIGSLSFSPYWSRKVFDLGRVILRNRGADVPPLDRLVQRFAVDRDRVLATLSLPARSGLVDQFAGDADRVSGPRVVRIYCRLAKANAIDPQTDFALQVRRAFPAAAVERADADTNRAAFIALAMFVVDRRMGQLADLNDAEMNRCPARSSPVLLHGRADLPKHWALSAALAARTGSRLAEAIGEWKELADSLSRRSTFGVGDPTGFSFVDLAADRSGFRAARAAISPDGAATMTERLSLATAATILPPPLLAQAEGMKGAAFVADYGAIDDPRYLRTRTMIDRALDRDGLTRP